MKRKSKIARKTYNTLTDKQIQKLRMLGEFVSQ